jgi:uncharacterized protein DUF481
LLGVAFLASPALCRDKTDVLVMKNGDRITCEVKRLEGGVLQADFDYVDGTVAIDWLKVARLESTALFLVQLQDGSIYSGKVITPDTLSGIPIKIEIQPSNAEESLTVDKSKVVRMTQTSESVLRRLSGGITLGTLYSKGNSTTQYSVGSTFDYRQTRWSSRFRYNSNLSSSVGAETATRNQADLSAYRLLPWKNYFYGGAAAFLQSSVQGIQRQTNLAFGLGRYFKNTNRVRFTALGGVGWQRTRYEPSVATQESQDVAVSLILLNLEAFSFKKSRLDLSASAVPALTDLGRLFYRTNLAYYLKLFGKVDWNFSFYGNWDTRPPPHFQGSDYGSSTGLSWTFGNN